ncbi:flagellar hook-associated family protein [Nitratireductor kimnyeongensis]|uniref:Flagellin n=1 Tax=Nitratireductor kimnyeongensis TaxID=430679 RepID=A0ABW0T9V5_9HYPH|nr:flagellar hook-associated family protein [Nitratireductor kimnyeongensis]QZZ36247.1 flagellar hook-associated family protein [Nitratireductor kimnyeongensis]
MKTSFISSLAMSQSLRYQTMRMQAELAERLKESQTGRHADVGVALGAHAGRNLSMTRSIDRLNGLVDANAIAANRLSATQNAMTQIGDLGQSLLASLTAAKSDIDQVSVSQAEAERVLKSMTGILNTNLNGEYLFAGINTDVKPMSDFHDPASPAKAAFDAAFVAKFGFAQNDPAAASITAADMDDFLTNFVEPQFLGAGWETDWSSASSQKITSRITLNETAETSLTANETGIRKLAMVAATISDLLNGSLGEEARDVLYDRSLTLVGEAVAEIANAQAQAGIVENRVSAASERLSAQVDLFTTLIKDSEGVDPYEAATRVNDLRAQLDASYALTARLQQLSILNYLR